MFGVLAVLGEYVLALKFITQQKRDKRKRITIDGHLPTSPQGGEGDGEVAITVVS